MALGWALSVRDLVIILELAPFGTWLSLWDSIAPVLIGITGRGSS